MGVGPLGRPGRERDNVVHSAGQYWNHIHPGEGHVPQIRQNTRPQWMQFLGRSSSAESKHQWCLVLPRNTDVGPTLGG